MKDYQKIITINKPASEVYAAITEHIADWWSDDLTGSATTAGDSFTISFGKTQKTMDIIEAIHDKQIKCKCVKAHIYMPSLKNKDEWIGTKLIWTIKADDQNTILTFLHEGLNPGFECYEVCEDGWDTFLGSLNAYFNNW